jgi:hypothetical protein
MSASDRAGAQAHVKARRRREDDALTGRRQLFPVRRGRACVGPELENVSPTATIFSVVFFAAS